MSGHSKWASIKHKKAAVDAKRGKLFTKIIREITVSARSGGGDPEANPSLRAVIQKAKDANMPSENIERAIKKGTGELEGVNYEEIVYEGYGPGGVAVLVETLSDNRNRTAANVRHLFSKYNGNLGESGCVSWIFERKGMITVPTDGLSEEDVFDTVVAAGADDMKNLGDVFEILTEPDSFDAVYEVVKNKGWKTEIAELTKIPKTMVELDDAKGKQMVKLMEMLDDHDDVQQVYTNADISDAVLADA